ncbi:phosphoethanolamine transferase [Pelomonas sp. SE-A7]|uniref:phosphoethanolamine transferase n=1 Tax=Pelomonas sp. SE-A7 TaxID=3054953 RepID=UPI00259C7082|nr:phosphoethanolamine transferase [Pelomonas sp. SE-A7]MDM4767635.1 phosphoethanolamine transferase [Pelomonas sp. SE-A7]
MRPADRLRALLLGLLLWLPGLATPLLAEGLDLGESLAVLLLSLFVLAVPLCLLQRLKLYFLLWLPLIPLIPVYVFLCAYYRSVPGDVLVSAALHSSLRDAWTMVASFGWMLLWVPACVVVYLVLLVGLGSEARWRWRRATLAGVLLYAMVGMLGRQDLAHYVKLPPLFDNQAASLVFPLNLVLSVQRSLERDRQDRAMASVQGRSESTEPMLVVLVIGESVRRDHLSLNGYARPTTPRLDSRRQELVSFSDAVSTAQWTAGAVPRLVSWEAPEGRASLVQTFREAGFKTAWLSNQEVSDLSRQADVLDHSTSAAELYFRKDISLLPPFESFVRQGGDRRFVVLHMMGSHFPYEDRYAADARQFRPTLTDAGISGQPQVSHRLETINSYDNTLVALDQFLARLIDSLRTQAGPALLIYTSDHGEALFEGEGGKLFMHGRPVPSCMDLDVPLIIWSNEAYRRQRGEAVAALRAHVDKRISHQDLFATTLDLAGVRWSGEAAGSSFASPGFVERPRPVQAFLGSPATTYEAVCPARPALRPSSRPTPPAPRR